MMSVVTSITDLVFALLPVFYLKTANLNMRTKVSVGGILCLASA